MKKSILNLGEVLTSETQKSIQGGGGFVCRAGYFNSKDTCRRGHHPHPVYGVSICCRAY
ncbi:hypothetical protein SAMN04489761_2432 [Tenacibaculum sp. MAR_2009_124]|uniref:hypothetical protein n=1 Tax=Tenacibaculum sp. MAR_2009_124 TaxID=1250059 RepID=UPI0008967934|nr:hypothetical protein [Tenacibaculum sp. MAR_2009_124]SEC22934.1 hypothetical protein SAMN04489761_2432 [Tenacibaculum sp. MAR_2009_124]